MQWNTQLIPNTNATSTNFAQIFQGNMFCFENTNNIQVTPQLSPQWISLTMHSPTPTTQATSPAATRTTPSRWQLAGREPAVRGNVRCSGPRSVPPEIVRTTPEAVILSSVMTLLRIKEGEDRLRLFQVDSIAVFLSGWS